MALADRRHRVELCLLAGALGDAWGGPYEGQAGPIDAIFPLHPALSDDTLLVLATCEAIVACGGFVKVEVIADRFRKWFLEGRLTGLGFATLKALRDLADGAHWALSGARGEFAAGSGAAMRAAPLAFLLDPINEADRVVVRDVARITHHSDEAYAGALAVVAAVRESSSADSVPADLLTRVADLLPDTAVRDRVVDLATDPVDPMAAALKYGCTGHVVDAVPLALLLSSTYSESIEEVVRHSVSIGGDADTIASIAAQIVGASGKRPPAEKLACLHDLPMLQGIVEEFSEFALNRAV